MQVSVAPGGEAGTRRSLLVVLRQSGAPWLRGASDVLMMLAQNGVTLGAQAVSSVLNARGLGPHNLGLVSLAMTVVNLSVGLTTMGVTQAALRYTSQEVAGGRMESAFAVLRWSLRHRLVFLLGLNLILFAGAGWLANSFWAEPELTAIIRWALPLGFIATIASVPDVYFQSLRRFHVSALVRIGETLTGLSGVLLLWALAWWTPFASVFVATAASAVGALLFLRLVPMRALVDLKELAALAHHPRRLLAFPGDWSARGGDLPSESPDAFARRVMVTSLLAALTFRIDYLVLGYFKSAEEAGIYSVASNLSLPLGSLAGALIAALFPRMSSETTYASMRVLLRRTTGICLVAFVGAAVYAYVLPPLAPMIFGERYSESTAVARLLCLHQGLTLIYAPLVIVGYGFGLAAAYVWLYLAQLAAVAVLTLLLVPGYGAAGAAIAWIAHDVITIVVLACMLGAQYRRSRGALAAVDPA